MASNRRFSWRGAAVALGIFLAIGLLAPAGSAVAQVVQGVWLVFCLGFVAVASFIVLGRMWQRRGDEAALWRAAHGGQMSVLPQKWRRWVLDERGER